jgi:hypothetical protein
VFDVRDDGKVQGSHNVLVTGPGHPYVDHFWPPGHIIGYEHTFIATLVDFLSALKRSEPFHPNFSDALEVQRVMEVVQKADTLREWVKTSSISL